MTTRLYSNLHDFLYSDNGLSFRFFFSDINKCDHASDLSNCSCESGKHACNERASCINIEGSYRCVCLPGYYGNGITCKDTDECNTGAHSCHKNAKCMNTLGSYECVCFSGFHGDGRSCVDTDECRDEINVCSVHARCENNPGSYRCSCKTGYSGNGMYCTGKLENIFSFFFFLGYVTTATQSIQICLRKRVSKQF